eukprot:3820222-Rhodomonas_salina.1
MWWRRLLLAAARSRYADALTLRDGPPPPFSNATFCQPSRRLRDRVMRTVSRLETSLDELARRAQPGRRPRPCPSQRLPKPCRGLRRPSSCQHVHFPSQKQVNWKR